MTRPLTRRRALGLAATTAAGAAGLSIGGYAFEASRHERRLRTVARVGPAFVSRPDLTPPPIDLHRYVRKPDARHIFLNAPYSCPEHGGAIILNHRGELVWFSPNTATHHKMDVNTQLLNGEPVLTWWQGISVDGYGLGEVVIADSRYQIKQIIRAHNGLLADLHEFTITPQGTALITAYRIHPGVDLTAVGGPSTAHLVSGVVQEIDIASGDLLFEWDSYDPAHQHVSLSETYQELQPGDGTEAQPFNYMHINSITQDADGDLLVSGRNTWTIYKVSKKDGSIIWRMNGKKSDFAMGPGANFFWQHHFRSHGHGTMTLFDNGSKPPEEKHSRALILNVDTEKMQVTLRKAFIHPGQVVLAGTMGSAQLLPDGGMFVCWGSRRQFSEFAPNGELRLDAHMGPGAPSYRAFAKDWVGHPTEPPAVAVRPRSQGAIVYVSWNGATKVASWTVYAGKTRNSLARLGTARRRGFETAILVGDSGPFYAVEARDPGGRTLSMSPTVRRMSWSS